MNYGLYLAASGALSNMYRQDVITNNLVNVETTGFKPDMVTARQRLPHRLVSHGPADPQLMLERLGHKIAVVHGHQWGSPRVADLAEAFHDFSVVVYGHTHIPLIEKTAAN